MPSASVKAASLEPTRGVHGTGKDKDGDKRGSDGSDGSLPARVSNSRLGQKVSSGSLAPGYFTGSTFVGLVLLCCAFITELFFFALG